MNEKECPPVRVNVSLTWPESVAAATAAIYREVGARFRGRSEPHGKPDMDPWGIVIESCGAEYAFSKVKKMHWVPHDPDLQSLFGDVGPFEVRHTLKSTGCLRLHEVDPDKKPFVLVQGRMPHYQVVGWIFAREGKIEKNWKGTFERPCFLIPPRSLRDIRDLPSSEEIDPYYYEFNTHRRKPSR
jgi:hypothetical protein